MNGNYTANTFLGVFLGVAILFPLAPLVLAWLWSRIIAPPKPGPHKNSIYECGLESKGDAWIQFRSEYYIYALILFLLSLLSKAMAASLPVLLILTDYFSGRKIKCYKVQAGIHKIDISFLATGMYIFQLVTPNGQYFSEIFAKRN